MLKSIWDEWVKPLIFAVVIAYLIHSFLFFIAFVPSASMSPTIQENDRLVVLRVHSFSELKRGDILLFEFEKNGTKTIFVKRLIGLPGDVVEIKNGAVFMNGTKLKEDYVVANSGEDYFKGGIKVPEGCYLFLGDNRANSYDSRFWEDPFIKREKIIGKAVFIIYPFGRMQIL